MRESKTILGFSHQITGVTGFAKQSRRILMGLDEAGHDVKVVSQNYKGEPIHPRELGNIEMLQIGTDHWGSDIVPLYMRKYQPDVVWTLLDVWCAHYISQMPKSWPWHWIRYFPFDTENAIQWWINMMKQTDLPVVFSKFADKLLANANVNHAYIPHGIDVENFRPAKKGEKERTRAEMEFCNLRQTGEVVDTFRGIPPNDFVVLCVAHNQFRKNLDRLLEAFAMFSQNKTDVKLVLHMQPRDQIGWDMPMLINELGLRGKVFFTNLNAKMLGDVFVSEEMMRDLYNMADCHALLTGGEGFGLPYAEAMSCGLPNIGTAWTTPKEFFADEKKTEKGIEITPTRGLIVPVSAVTWHHTGGHWGIANTEIGANAMQWLYENRDAGIEMGKKARRFVVKNYDWKKLIPKWVDLVDNVAELSTKREPETFKLKLVDVD